MSLAFRFTPTRILQSAANQWPQHIAQPDPNDSPLPIDAYLYVFGLAVTLYAPLAPAQMSYQNTSQSSPLCLISTQAAPTPAIPPVHLVTPRFFWQPLDTSASMAKVLYADPNLPPGKAVYPTPDRVRPVYDTSKGTFPALIPSAAPQPTPQPSFVALQKVWWQPQDTSSSIPKPLYADPNLPPGKAVYPTPDTVRPVYDQSRGTFPGRFPVAGLPPGQASFVAAPRTPWQVYDNTLLEPLTLRGVPFTGQPIAGQLVKTGQTPTIIIPSAKVLQSGGSTGASGPPITRYADDFYAEGYRVTDQYGKDVKGWDNLGKVDDTKLEHKPGIDKPKQKRTIKIPTWEQVQPMMAEKKTNQQDDDLEIIMYVVMMDDL